MMSGCGRLWKYLRRRSRDGRYRALAVVEWAAGRPFIWIDDEHTDADRAWVSENYEAPALLHFVDACKGLTDEDFGILSDWLVGAGSLT